MIAQPGVLVDEVKVVVAQTGGLVDEIGVLVDQPGGLVDRVRGLAVPFARLPAKVEDFTTRVRTCSPAIGGLVAEGSKSGS